MLKVIKKEAMCRKIKTTECIDSQFGDTNAYAKLRKQSIKREESFKCQIVVVK